MDDTRVFVDTSAVYAVLDRNDAKHSEAATIWNALLDRLDADEVSLITSGAHLIEMTALVQHRLGMDATRALLDDIVGLFDVIWVDAELHGRATTALLAADRRDVSLVDWTAFEIMRARAISHAFAFDDDFERQGHSTLNAES